MATPAIATTALLSFTAKWNEYLWPLIVTFVDQLRTSPISLRRLLDAEGNAEWGVVMAAAILIVIPVIVVLLTPSAMSSKDWPVARSRDNVWIPVVSFSEGG